MTTSAPASERLEVQPPDARPGAPAELPALPVALGVAVSLAVALLVAMSELSRLTGEVLDQQGRTWPVATLMGPGRLLDPFAEGWSATFAEGAGARRGWLAAYLVLDLVLIAVYGRWLRRRLLRWADAPVPTAVSGQGVPTLRWQARRLSLLRLARVLGWLAAVDLVEDGLALVVGVAWPTAPAVLGRATGAVSAVKTALLLVVLALVVRHAAGPARPAVRRWQRALYRQRFSLLAVVPVAVLGIPGGSDLLDQVPDAQRRWLSDGQGVLHLLAAVVAIVVGSVGTFVLGRLRAGAVWRRTAESVRAEERAVLSLGLIGPVVLAAGIAVAVARSDTVTSGLPGLLPGRVALFAGVPLAVVAASYGIRRHLERSGRPRGAGRFEPALHRVTPRKEKETTALAGDLVATAAVVVGGLGLVRSMTVIVALGASGRLTVSWGAVALLLLGVAAAVGIWPAGRWLRTLATLPPLPPATARPQRVHDWYAALSPRERVCAVVAPDAPNPPRLGVRVGVIACGLGLFAAIGYWPGWFAATVGIIATALLALLGAALVIGGSVVSVQDRLAPELFWWKPIRLASLPVTSLLVATIAFASSLGSSIDVHGVRAGLGGVTQPVRRPGMSTALDAWTAATAGCGHTVTLGGREVTLRALPLVAAEGGGIRAAYWTTAALDLARGVGRAVGPSSVDWAARAENPCARALFGAGASGGSVGLTVARFAGDASARGRVVSMAGPDALGAATAGLFVRDLSYAATGVPFFGAPRSAVPGGEPTWAWDDRASLIEHSWERTSGLDQPFLTADPSAAAASVSGALVVNSTRVGDGCRMWVSQLELGSPTDTCDGPTGPAGHTLDLFASLAPGSTDATGPTPAADCLGNPSAATAALLTARFPFVTPSGVVGPCGTQPEQQLVDGGYVENSGLATVVDLGPQWLGEVQQRNARALGAGGDGVVLVPTVVYLDNGAGGDLVTDPPAPTSEALVPSTTNGRAKGALLDTAALLRLAGGTAATGRLLPPGVVPPAGLTGAVDAWRPHPVTVVHQSTTPAVNAPLGWVLSDQSIQTMDRALAQQARGADPTGAPPSVTANGSLGDLIRLLAPDRP